MGSPPPSVTGQAEVMGLPQRKRWGAGEQEVSPLPYSCSGPQEAVTDTAQALAGSSWPFTPWQPCTQ